LTPTPSPLQDKLADATGYPHPTVVLRQVNIPHPTAASARRAPRVPLLTVTKGQPRSLMSPVAEYP
jgi:hypothetical protein